MIKTIQGIPVYRAILGDNTDGMERISLVDYPAVESDFLAFSKDKKPMMFAVENEEKRIIRGVVMRADYPIYRIGANGYEYFIVFEKDTIREMAQKYLKESRQNDVNLQHEDGSDVEGVEMVQWFIKDTENGINPKGFEDISEGSLFAEFKVENDDVWDAVKEGEFKGFSLEGLFSHEVMTLSAQKVEIINLINNTEDMTKIEKIKEALGKVLVEQEEQKFGAVGTDKGVLHWEGEDDLVADMEVWHEDEEGNRTTPEDGDYTTEDKKVIKVEGGKVTEIVDPVAEVDEGNQQEPEEDEKLSAFRKHVEKMSKSYDEKREIIAGAIGVANIYEDWYIVEAGDNYCVINAYNEDDWRGSYYKHSLTWDGEDKVTIGEGVEVKQAFVPIDYEAQFAKIEKRVDELTDLFDTLTEKLSKMSLALPAKKEFKKEVKEDKFSKGLDRAKAMAEGLKK